LATASPKLGKAINVGKLGFKIAGPALAVYGAYQDYKSGVAAGQSKGEAASGALGKGVGGFAISGGGVDTAINLANAALTLAGAPKGVTDVSSVVAEATPSSFGGAALGQTTRAVYNIASGNMKGVDQQVREMQRGQSGAPLQGYALMTELFTNVLEGKEIYKSLDEAARKGEGPKGERSSLAQAGTRLGDVQFQSIEVWKQVIGDVRAGKPLGAAVDEAEKANKFRYGEGAASRTLGLAAGLGTVRFVAREAPKVVEAAKSGVAKLRDKVDEATKGATEVGGVAKEEFHQAVENVKDRYEQAKDYMEQKASALKENVSRFLPWLR
jgi:hypothetical protein